MFTLQVTCYMLTLHIYPPNDMLHIYPPNDMLHIYPPNVMLHVSLPMTCYPPSVIF